MVSTSAQHPRLAQIEAARLRFVPVCAALLLALVAAVLPPDALRPLNLVGYAVCHRIPERSFFINQRQLPVCARDTGMFTGALAGLIVAALTLRKRASGFPTRPYAVVFGLCFAAWAFDGFNSYVMLITRQPLFYLPQNWLRLVTGAFMGVSLSTYVVALINQALWRDAVPDATVSSWGDVARLAGLAGIIVAVVLWQPDVLYGPIAALSSAGVLTLLGVVNGLLVLIATKRHGLLERWSQTLGAGVLGLILTVAEILMIDLLRAAATGGAGWPL